MLENKAKYPRGHQHKILIIGDSHVRGCVGKMSASLDARFEVCGVIKPGSCTESIRETMKEEVDNLTMNDFLILSSGSTDINRNDSRIAFNTNRCSF
jgi:predicted PP-loop superfamily ATPase